jgi:hypothetical protein
VGTTRPAAPLAALACALALVAGGAGRAQTADAERARLTAAHRDARAALDRASSASAPVEGRRERLVLADHLERLGAEPAAGAATILPDGLRADLQRQARALRDDRAGGPAALDACRALLDRVGAALAPTLDFQGSYSQSKPKERAYGGHASAMGPAPAPAPADSATAAAIDVAVEFVERVRLASKTYAGGPTKDHILESAGSGLALVDYDGDGLLDIYLVTAAQLTAARERIPHRNALYRNLGDWQFEDVTARAGVGLEAWGSGVCAGDADGDGQLDLYVTNWGTNALFRNRGDGTFEEIAARSGVAAGGWSTGCAFLDADADGDLDLYVARYVATTWDDLLRARRTLVWRNGPRIMVGPAGLPGEPDAYFENLGGGRFRDATAAAGLTDAAGAYGFGVVATDYDADGDVDLFVANDSNPNFLYRNRGDGRFESVGLLAGVAVNADARAQAGMGADAGDYDGDGRLDLVLTAFAHDRNTIYRNVDGQQFEDVAAATGLATTTFTRMGWGVAWMDADLDGRQDLFVANGHIFADVDEFPALGETFRQKSQLLLNTGSRFADVSARAGDGLQVARVGRGLAVGDLDNDGDLDVVVSNMDEAPTVLENRQRGSRSWIAARVTAPDGNRFAIGARVTLRAAAGVQPRDGGPREQIREIRSGGSFLSQSDLRVFVGLGDRREPVDVEVRMPGGRTWRWDGLAVNRIHDLTLTPDREARRGRAGLKSRPHEPASGVHAGLQSRPHEPASGVQAGLQSRLP